MKTLENIKIGIIESIKPDFDFLKSLKNSKVVITIVDGPKVTTKIIEILPKKERVVLPKEVRSKIKIIKKAVKVNTDITWLLSLIDDVKKCVQNLDFKVISPEGVIQIKAELDSLDAILGKTTLKLEHLSQKGESK